ncbi:MAG: MBL fold metallo-hydrolase [Bdellovibrio sp.]|nr:MAG: MBL fold metallo-hydrolase [Bdellovibrio sp.]
MEIKAFFDKDTFTLTYVVWDQESKKGVIIDPVLDYDPASSTYRHYSVDQVVDYVKEHSLSISYILETHAHADHLSGAQELKRRLEGSQVAIGAHITEVQSIFKDFFNLKDFPTDGSQFDRLLEENEVIQVGNLEIKVLYTPGHTPACSSYLINKEAVFTGDVLFMPDYGVARCDFPGGDARALYHSVKEKLYTLPDSTKYYPAHDYMPNGRALRFEATIGESKESNVHLSASTTEEDFVKFRTERDKKLSAPRLLLPSVEVNIAAGHLPPPEDNQVSYLKIPIRPGKEV